MEVIGVLFTGEYSVLTFGVGDGGVCAVAREHKRRLGQRVKLGGDAVDDLLEVGGAAGSTGAAGE